MQPAAKSRGRGISTFADLPKLLRYVEAGSGSGREGQWVVQKYMENPLIIAKRKFDLRQVRETERRGVGARLGG